MELPLEGTSTILSFFLDDTIETVRQQVALAKGTHPDRLFIEVEVELPKDYYSSNPKRWMDLFFRLSHGKNVVSKDIFEAYLTQVRLGTDVIARDVTRRDWQAVEGFLEPLYRPKAEFKEWRILGVPEEKSMILPIPPRDVDLKEAFRPVPGLQLLFDTVHRETAVGFKAVEVAEDASDTLKQVYFPLFKTTTPANIESLRATITTEHTKLKNLMELNVPKPTHTTILRSKWYIPFISTTFSAPRNRFEQMFYGMTVSKKTPVVSFFTSKGETIRHKFFVENPKEKKPLLDIPMWKSWMSNTQPQRRLPTLLFYRGKSRVSFDRIAVTNKDITVSVYRSKDSKDTLETLQKTTLEWLESLDAVVPFLVATDIDPSRWVLNDLSSIASYAKEISTLDLRRLGCFRSVFSQQDTSFRLIRADRESDIPPDVVRAKGILDAGDSLEKEMGLNADQARELTEKVRALEVDKNFNLEKAMTGYPVITFSAKDVFIKFVTKLERTIDYVSIFRHVMTSDSDEVNTVCPPRLEVVEPTANVAPPSAEPAEGLDVLDMSAFDDLEGGGGSNAAAAPANGPDKKLKVKKTGPVGTHGYFNARILQIDPNLVEADYAKVCEKPTQVVVLTPEHQGKIGEKYNYTTAPENEKMKVDKGIAICPQYWCMRDEIPLSEQQLVNGECPECGGKVRVTDKEDLAEYTVIKRKVDYKYPDFKDPSDKSTSKKKVPCCYKTPAGSSEVLAPKTDTDEYYVLTSGTIPALRIAYLPNELTKRISVKTNYAKTCPKNRIEASMTDMFHIGLGLPRTTLPVVLNDKRNIPSPAHAKDKVMQCSFFRTWRDMGDGDDEIERIVSGIDRAWDQKTMNPIDEIEYVALILDCRVMQINMTTNKMSCGFWSDITSARSRTITLLNTDILGKVTRRKGKTGSKFDYVVDINKFEDVTRNALQALNTSACATSIPTVSDAQKELATKNISDYQFIMDPFKRVQALFVPNQVVLPVHPMSMDIPEGGSVRSGYADIVDEELPASKSLREFLDTTLHPGFKRTGVMLSPGGVYTEFMLESGFRAPFNPEEAEEAEPDEPVTGVMSTIRNPHSEEELVSAPPNRDDLKLASDISYSSEVFEFMLFSISKDIQTADHADLHAAIQTPGLDLLRTLRKWMNSEAHWDVVNEPVQFVNKIRTPCGQMKEESCKKSTLCGWHEDTCKIKVKSIVDKEKLLTRLAKTLKDNSKQRALVLDGTLSPFFSTVLYLEMPHELITTSP